MKAKQEDFPLLFQEKITPWGSMRTVFKLGVKPPAHLISNVYIVPFVEDKCVIIRTDKGWGITGGTLEPEEHYLEAIQREVREEAGADLVSFTRIGAWHCYSLADQPYRPHLPWPEFYRIVGFGEVDLTGSPTNPEGGEQVFEVATLPLKEACRRLSLKENDGPELAEIYRLAALLKGQRGK